MRKTILSLFVSVMTVADVTDGKTTLDLLQHTESGVSLAALQ